MENYRTDGSEKPGRTLGAPLRDRIVRGLLVTFLYTVIAVLHTYPLFLDLGGSYIENPTGGSNDQFGAMWNAWWLKKSLFELHSTPMSTSYLFFPAGHHDMSLKELTIVNGFISIPFQMLLPKPHGVVVGYNVAVIFSFVLAGIGAYALCHYHTQNRFASFVAGFAYAFAPYRNMHIIHLNILSTGWIPLYLLFLLKTIRKPRFSSAGAASLVTLLMFYSCMMYIYFIFLPTLVIILYYAVLERRQFFTRRLIISLALLGLLCSLAVLPQAVLIMRAGEAQTHPWEMVELFSANAAGYFIPSWKHLLYKPLVSILPSLNLSGVPGDGTFLGYGLVILAGVGIVRTRPKVWGLWVIMAFLFYVLSLGPSLHILAGTFEIPLPYTLFHRFFPFFGVMRTPHRFSLLVTLSCAVLASYGLSSFLSGGSKQAEQIEEHGNDRVRRSRLFFGVGMALFLMLELWNIPFVAKRADVPKVYFEIAKEEGDFGIIDLPNKRYRDIARYMFYQTVHEKPMAKGLHSRRAEHERRRDVLYDPLEISSSEQLGPKELTMLEKNGFRYVILHSITDDTDIIHQIIKLSSNGY